MKNHIEVRSIWANGGNERLQYEINALLERGDKLISVVLMPGLDDLNHFKIVICRNVSVITITEVKT